MKKTFLSTFFLALVVALFSATSLRAQEVTFDFAANEWNHPTASVLDKATAYITDGLEKDGVQLVFKYGTSSAMPYYNNSGPRVVIANNQIMKVFAPAGKAVTKISFNHGTYFNLSADGLSGDEWTGNTTCVKFIATGTAQINSMVVTLADKTGETTTPTEADEEITVDFDDSETHSEFKNDDSNITADINVVDKAGSTGESRLYTLIPATTDQSPFTSQNRWYYITSEFTKTLRIFNEKMVFKTDKDKVIKSISMKVKTWNSGNKLNGETVNKSTIQAGVEVNANEVELELAGQSVIYTITAVIADKPAGEEPAEPLVPTAFDPADNSTVGSYFYASFTAKFAEAVTVDNEKVADIKLYKGSVDAANVIAPEAGSWTVELNNGSQDVRIYSMDEYNEGVQTIISEEGQKYILVIPAGLVKSAAGVANDELTLTLNGPAPTFTLESSNPANNATLEAGYQDMSFELTFAEAVNTTSELLNSGVTLTKNGTALAPESWGYNLSNENKTVQVFGMDMDGFTDSYKVEEGDVFVLTIAKDVFSTEAGAKNKEIQITLNGPAPAPKLVPVSYDPAENSTVSSYFYASFTAKFDEALTLDESKIAAIKLYEKIGDASTELTPDDAWYATLESDKKNLFIHAQDYDGFTQGFAAKEGAKYQLVIPAGIVKNEAGIMNDELTLTLNGPVPTLAMVSSEPANNATLEAGYQAMTFSLTFDKAVTTTSELLNSGVTLTKNGTALAPESWGYNLSNENKTVQVFGMDMDGYTDSYKVEAGDVFVLTIAKEVFATETGAKNEEIQITLNGPEKTLGVLALESSNPADGATLEAGYQAMSFELTFAEAATTTSEKLNAGVTLTKNGSQVDVYSWDCNMTDKTAQVFGMDMDGFTDSYKVEEGDIFVLTIAKGVFTTDNAENAEIQITLNGPAAPADPFNPTNIEPGDGDELYKFYGNYAMPHLELTFDENIVNILATNPAIELRKGSVDGEKLPISGWKAELVDEHPEMLTLDAWDYNAGSNIWFEAEDVDYYWIIPAGIVANAEGGQNEQIILMQKGIVKPLTVVSTKPANESTVEPGYHYYQFYVTFAEDIEILDATPNKGVKFYENGELKLPFGADPTYGDAVDVWHAMKGDDAKTLYIWGDDGYGFVDTYQTIADAEYKLVIPAGIVKDAAGNKNGEITIVFTCSAGTGISNVKDAAANAKEQYNLNGQRINASQKGVQILRLQDGRTVKVHVK